MELARVNLLLGAARIRRERIHLVDTWTFITQPASWPGRSRSCSARDANTASVFVNFPGCLIVEPRSAITRSLTCEAFLGDMNMHGWDRPGFWVFLPAMSRRSCQSWPDQILQAGDTMCHEGDPATYLYVLVTGWVKILSVTSDGQERVLALRGQGTSSGKWRRDHRSADATVQAVDPVCALIVGYERFSSFLDSHPGADHAYDARSRSA